MTRTLKHSKATSNRLALYAQLIRLHKPVGIFLLLWPTLWALFIAADGWPGLSLVVVFVLGVILMRSAGCAINDYADRNIDPLIKRTRLRALACGAIQPGEALVVCAVLACIALLLVVFFLNRLTLYFALVGGLLAASYPYMKRVHPLPQVHLGAAFAWSVPMAFTAVNNAYPPSIAWLLFTCAVVWTVMYDTMYAMADREEDIKIGVRSVAILLDSLDKLAIGLMQVFVIASLVLIGINAQMSGVYFLAICAGAGFFIYQQLLIKQRLADHCFNAFLNNQYFGLVVFIGICAHYWINPGR